MSTCWIETRWIETGWTGKARARRADPRPATVAVAEIATPSGPEAAAEAFEWMNRQLSWQSRLAELEGVGVTTRRRARTSSRT